MTDPNYTHVSLAVDRSGSMAAVRAEAEGGINALLAKQFALPGRLTVTLAQFDTEFDTVARMSAESFEYQLEPRGMTALLDAVGSEIEQTGVDLAALPEDQRPARVLFVVVTDGQENASSAYTLQQVRGMVEHQRQAYGWDFQFIGAGEAAWQGRDLGMAAATHAPDGNGNLAAYAHLSASMTAYRAAAPATGFAMPDDVSAAPGS